LSGWRPKRRRRKPANSGVTARSSPGELVENGLKPPGRVKHKGHPALPPDALASVLAFFQESDQPTTEPGQRLRWSSHPSPFRRPGR
jgi:hypothetical protein